MRRQGLRRCSGIEVSWFLELGLVGLHVKFDQAFSRALSMVLSSHVGSAKEAEFRRVKFWEITLAVASV